MNEATIDQVLETIKSKSQTLLTSLAQIMSRTSQFYDFIKDKATINGNLMVMLRQQLEEIKQDYGYGEYGQTNTNSILYQVAELQDLWYMVENNGSPDVAELKNDSINLRDDMNETQQTLTELYDKAANYHNQQTEEPTEDVIEDTNT